MIYDLQHKSPEVGILTLKISSEVGLYPFAMILESEGRKWLAGLSACSLLVDMIDGIPIGRTEANMNFCNEEFRQILTDLFR